MTADRTESAHAGHESFIWRGHDAGDETTRPDRSGCPLRRVARGHGRRRLRRAGPSLLAQADPGERGRPLLSADPASVRLPLRALAAADRQARGHVQAQELRRPVHVPGRARPAGNGVRPPGLVPPDPADGREQGLLRRLGRRVDRLALRHLTEDAHRLSAQRPLERPVARRRPRTRRSVRQALRPLRRVGLRTPQKGVSSHRSRGTFASRRTPMARARATTILSLALALLALGSSAGAGGSSAATTATSLGPNVIVFDPSMPVGADPGDPRRDPRAAGRRRDGHRTATRSCSSRASTARPRSRCRSRSATTPRSPASAPRRPTSTINGKIEVYNRCLDDGGTSNCLALVNFWRTLSNLTLNINALGQDGCRASANFWAVSQAVSMRRLNITGGNLSLMDYCTAGPQFASGGFIADSKLPFVDQRLAAAVADPQQPRSGAGRTRVWNQVFAGVEGAPSDADVPEPAVHHARDDAGEPGEAVPVRRRAGRLQGPRAVGAAPTRSGTPGATAMTAGRTIPLGDFFVAKPSRLGAGRSTASSRAARTCCSPRASTTSGSSIEVKRAGHGRARHRPRDAHRRRTARSR